MKNEKTCVYCKQTKKDSDFNKEHVIPQSFGKFSENLILQVVCRECNTDYFSKTIELNLGRDSSLGLLYRSFFGLIDSKKFKKSICYQRRDTETVIYDDNYGELIVNVGLNNERNFDVSLANQVVIMNSLKAKQCSFRLEKLPHRNALEILGLNPANGYIKLFYPLPLTNNVRKEIEEINRIFKEKDISFKIKPENFVKFRLFHNGPLLFKHRISDSVARALAKIVFNYFVYQYGPEVALGESFDKIRNFIRYDRRSLDNMVMIEIPKILDFQSIQNSEYANYEIDIKKDNTNIIGTILLFKHVTCKVILTSFYQLAIPNIRTFFSLNDKTITHFYKIL